MIIWNYTTYYNNFLKIQEFGYKNFNNLRLIIFYRYKKFTFFNHFYLSKKIYKTIK